MGFEYEHWKDRSGFWMQEFGFRGLGFTLKVV